LVGKPTENAVGVTAPIAQAETLPERLRNGIQCSTFEHQYFILGALPTVGVGITCRDVRKPRQALGTRTRRERSECTPVHLRPF
jgi:hypothetical protein